MNELLIIRLIHMPSSKLEAQIWVVLIYLPPLRDL